MVFFCLSDVGRKGVGAEVEQPLIRTHKVTPSIVSLDTPALTVSCI